MKSTGIVRNIDELGRLVIPTEIRDERGFVKNTPVEIFVEDDAVIVKKYVPVCRFCGSGENLTEYLDQNVCRGCIEKLGELLK